MPDPALSQAQCDSLFDRLLEPLALYRQLRQQHEKLTLERVSIREFDGNGNGFLSNWVITTSDITALTDGGYLYVRIADETPGAGQATVSVYCATGAGSGDKIMEGSAADSGTATLSEQNSSGWSGTVDLGTVSSSVANDNHYLIVEIDWPRRARQVFNGDEDADLAEGLTALWKGHIARIASNLKSGMDRCKTFVRQLNQLYTADRILAPEGVSSAGYDVSARANAEGLVTNYKSGILRELELFMAENTTAQAVEDRPFSNPTAAADSTNRGKLTFGTISLEPGARPGNVLLECTKGGSDNFGSEEVRVTLKPSSKVGPNRNDASLIATNVLKIGSTYRAPELGILSMSVSRDVDKSGDGSNTEFSSADITVSGENTTNTNAGVLYGIVTGTSPNLTVSFYKASGGASGDLVAQATGISNSSAFTATAQNSSGLTVTGTTGSTPTATEVTFDLNGLESDSSGSNVPDRWSFTVPSATSEGYILETLADMFGPHVQLRKVTAGSETIPDGRVQRGAEDPTLTVVG